MTAGTTAKRLVFVDGLPDCPDCMDHLMTQPHLVGACASVGIEFGKTTQEMFRSYIAGHHFGGHR